MKVKSEALEAGFYATYAYLNAVCPYCSKENNVYLGNLDDITAPDVEAIKCWNCSKKFWCPGSKDIAETNAGIGWKDEEVIATCDELGLEPGADLIETAFVADGKEHLRIA